MLLWRDNLSCRWLHLSTAKQSSRFYFPAGWGSHFWLQVLKSFNGRFPCQWICRGDPIPWHARSSDKRSFKFFFWGFVKDYVYRTPVRDIEELKQRITEVVTLFNTNVLANTWVKHRRLLFFCMRTRTDTTNFISKILLLKCCLNIIWC